MGPIHPQHSELQRLNTSMNIRLPPALWCKAIQDVTSVVSLALFGSKTVSIISQIRYTLSIEGAKLSSCLQTRYTLESQLEKGGRCLKRDKQEAVLEGIGIRIKSCIHECSLSGHGRRLLLLRGYITKTLKKMLLICQVCKLRVWADNDGALFNRLKVCSCWCS